MYLLEYKSGDCGVGYFKSFMIINFLVLVAFVPIMCVLLSWVMIGNQGVIFIPFILRNVFMIPCWILGACALIPGFLAAYTESDSQRNATLNVWAIVVGAFAIAVICCGVNFVHLIAKDSGAVGDAFDHLLHKVGKHGPQIGPKMEAVADRAVAFCKDVINYEIFHSLPYPYSAVYLLHWQIGLTAFAFCIIPSILSLWAFYMVLGSRNYFATNPDAFKNAKISEGPLFADESYHSSEHSESEDSDTDNQEAQPLSKRRDDFSASSQRTQVMSPAGPTTVRGTIRDDFSGPAGPTTVRGTIRGTVVAGGKRRV